MIPNDLTTVLRKFKLWKNITYLLVLFNFLLFIAEIWLISLLDDLSETKQLLGYVQVIVGLFLLVLLSISIYFKWTILILAEIICSNILGLACGVMFILLKLSENMQIYDGKMSFAPPHPKSWFKIYEAYFILSLSASSLLIVMTFFSYKTRKILNQLIHSCNDLEVWENQRRNISIAPTDLNESLLKRNYGSSNADLSEVTLDDEPEKLSKLKIFPPQAKHGHKKNNSGNAPRLSKIQREFAENETLNIVKEEESLNTRSIENALRSHKIILQTNSNKNVIPSSTEKQKESESFRAKKEVEKLLLDSPAAKGKDSE